MSTRRRLKKIAQIANGQFYRATDTKSLEQIFAQIDKLEKSTVELTNTRSIAICSRGFSRAGFGLLALQVGAGPNRLEEAAMRNDD